MIRVALRMLLGDKAKYLSLVFGLGFAVLLITQQGSIFLGLVLRATGPLQNVANPDLWVADPFVKWISETRSLAEDDLSRVRSVPGVAWAEPFLNVRANCELENGDFRSVNMIGISRATMVGRPPEMTLGRLEDLRLPDAVLVEDSARSKLGDPAIGDILKLNDRRAVIVGFCRAKAGFDSNAVIYTTFENGVNFLPLGRDIISYILVGVKPDASVAAVQSSIGTLPDLRAYTSDEMRWLTVNFIISETGIGINFGITVFLGLIVGLVVSATIFYQFTLENLRNFGVLKAMGARRRTLIIMILTQALAVGLIAFGVGVGAASTFTLMSRKPGVELAAYFPWQLLLGSLVGMLLCIAGGSFLSLAKVIRLEPAIVFK